MATSSMVGEYFDGGSGGEPVSTGSYFTTTPGGQMTGFGRSPDGLGRLGDMIPVVAELRARKRSPCRNDSLNLAVPLGDEMPAAADPTAADPSVGLWASGLSAMIITAAIRGTAGYYIGRAVAPSADKERKYAMWGIANGMLFGTLGLGVQAAIGYSNRR